MLDAYSIGYIIGRLLFSMIIVYFGIFLYSKFNAQLAWQRMKDYRIAFMISLVLVIPMLANIKV